MSRRFLGLPEWTTQLSLKRQAQLHEMLTRERHRAGEALAALSERVEASIRAEQPEKAFVEEYNRGYGKALKDVFVALGGATADRGGYQTYAINGVTARVGQDGRMTMYRTEPVRTYPPVDVPGLEPGPLSPYGGLPWQPSGTSGYL